MAWKLQDAKARLSELVRRARTGAPQYVTVHGKEAVVIIDPARFEVRPKPKRDRTMAGFIGGSKKYRGTLRSVEFARATGMSVRDKRRRDFRWKFFR